MLRHVTLIDQVFDTLYYISYCKLLLDACCFAIIFYALVILIVILTVRILVLVIVELLETPITEKISLSIMKFLIWEI